jgi:hypothetical protein
LRRSIAGSRHGFAAATGHGLRNRCLSAVAIAILAAAGWTGGAPAAHAIEMFTFFGDGSRVGLPSLEVPIEAYPGIPLRSDRIRMRTGRFGRGWRPGAGRGPFTREAVELGGAEAEPPAGITIRPMTPADRPGLPPEPIQPPAGRRSGGVGILKPLPVAPLPPE